MKSVPIRVSKCEHCSNIALWFQDTLVFPATSNAPRPNPDMPTDARADYQEAADICARSPRAAAALLRLAIQQLCANLGGQGQNLNEDIAGLVARGLPRQVQQALDVVRVTGNNAVHPGQMDVTDAGIATNLFGLVNIIVEYMISMPNRVGAAFEQLPQGARDAIAKRDGTV